MPLEIEIKLRVGDHEIVRRALEECAATFVKRQLETNTLFDTAGDELLEAGCGLRLRSARDLQTGDVYIIITHKGPRKPGPMKIREESELHVTRYDDAVVILAKLGYEIRLSFEKRRETWLLDECEVVLDELPGSLGRYVEIEGASEQTVMAVRHRLALESATIEPQSYPSIVAKYLESSGKSQLTFGD